MQLHESSDRGLLATAIWHDDDLIELESQVTGGDFRGRATTYTTPERLTQFADAILRFDSGAESEARFDSALGDGSKALHIRLYRYDSAGHIAAHVRIVTDSSNVRRSEGASSLETELRTEAASIIRFAHELRQLAERKSGSAFLLAVL